MPFFLVSRSRYDEMMREKERAISLRDERITKLEATMARLEDLIFKQTFGVQLHDSLPLEDMRAIETEHEAQGEEAIEAELAAQASADRDRLASIRRTRPSQLGSEITRMLQRNAARRVNLAHPAHRVFGKAMEEVSQ